MAKWQSNAESGILRKNPTTENHEDLLVFGYACKLFRDDEKALYIDQGKHLIPWMGDETLKIDRYDGRGALSELSQYEASREGYDTMRWLGLSESERRIEQLCDEERYYALNVNEEDEELYKEEELKRLQQKSNEYQFNYDVQPDPEGEKVPTVELEDEVFVPPPELDVPSDITIPKTVKENTRIEKTALFVSKQGLQMEILIKTKQADNPQFGFLNQKDPLYKYYKHLLMIIKSGRYKVQSKENSTEQNQEQYENETSDDHYLHPSLLATSVQSAPPATSTPLTIPYRPSADCKYLQLVNRIQGNQQHAASPVLAVPQPQPEAPPQQQTVPQSHNQTVSPHLTYEQQQYYQQYYYAMQYYEYYKQMAQQYAEGEMDPKVAQYFQGLTQLVSFMQAQGIQNMAAMGEMPSQMQSQVPDNPYAQIVSNLSQSKEHVSYAPVTVAEQGEGQTLGNIAKAPVIYSQEQVEPVVSSPVVSPSDSPKPSPQIISDTVANVPKEEPTTGPKNPLLHFAHYNSDSEESCDNNDESKGKEEEVTLKESSVKVPNQEVQMIIDKMASYVSKNGIEFEAIVKAKGDNRFEFLNEGHEFHEYYKQKLGEYNSEMKPKKDENKDKDAKKQQQNGAEPKPKEKKIITPVSFSIKKSKDDTPKEIKSALPIEESDEEEENSTTATSTATTTVLTTTSTTITSQSQNNTSETYSPSRTPPLRDLEQRQIVNLEKTKETSADKIKKSEDAKDSKTSDNDDPILEMIDLTDDVEERKLTRRAADRKRDKIAAAARERLALQLERKRKAAVFLKLMSVDSAKAERRHVQIKNNSAADVVPIASSNRSNSHGTRGRSGRESSRDESRGKTARENDSDYEEGEIKKHKKSSKKKKSHKRKHSREKRESRHHHKEHKKSKKRRRSRSYESHSSNCS